jgi:hypothetical protein
MARLGCKVHLLPAPERHQPSNAHRTGFILQSLGQKAVEVAPPIERDEPVGLHILYDDFVRLVREVVGANLCGILGAPIEQSAAVLGPRRPQSAGTGGETPHRFACLGIADQTQTWRKIDLRPVGRHAREDRSGRFPSLKTTGQDFDFAPRHTQPIQNYVIPFLI